MLLYELLEVINDSAMVQLWDNNSDIIGTYDGKESISEEYEDCQVWDIFQDICITDKGSFQCIGIEIDFERDSLEDLEEIKSKIAKMEGLEDD